MSSVASEKETKTRKNDNELSETMSNIFYIAHKSLKRTTTNSLQVIVLIIIQQIQFLNILFDSWVSLIRMIIPGIFHLYPILFILSQKSL